MEFYIQMGHGMQQMILELLQYWKQGNVILSPINIAADRIEKFAQDIHSYKGKIIFDPQLYLPREKPHRLSDYSYWPQNNITLLENGAWDRVLAPLVDLNNKLKTQCVILPAFFDNAINEQWGEMQDKLISSAFKYLRPEQIIHTLALSSNVLLDAEQVEMIISKAEDWNIHGFYLVCQHPNNAYLVDNPIWICNLLTLITGLKRTNKKIVLGFANHQMLCAGLAKCDAIAAGNFLNTRHFMLNRFEVNDDENDISRRSVWYYAPQTLSEYKITFLDLAQQQGILSLLKPTNAFENPYSSMLFTANKPSSSSYGESLSHRHYLCALKLQVENLVQPTFRNTVHNYTNMLQESEKLLRICHAKAIKCAERDFLPILDALQAATLIHQKNSGFVLEREWNSL